MSDKKPPKSTSNIAAPSFPTATNDLRAQEREILDLLSGLCAAPERDELRIAALRALLKDVQEQINARDQGGD